MKKTTLKNLREEYESLRQLMQLDLSNWDPRTRPGMLGKQNAAKGKLENVSLALTSAILRNSSTILIMRDFENTGDIVESANKNPKKNVIVDYLDLEKNMFKSIFDRKTQSLTFNSEVVSKMNILMNAVGSKIGAASFPAILANSAKYGTVKTKSEMVLKMEVAMDETFGNELRPLYLRSILVDEVLNRFMNEDSINVLIVNVTPEFTSALSRLTGKFTILSNETAQATQPATETVETKPATVKPVRATTRRNKPAAAENVTEAKTETLTEGQ